MPRRFDGEVADRALRRLGPQHPDECWIWPGVKVGAGYGHISDDRGGRRGMRLVHRVVYEALVGPIPEGLTLDHLCRTPACANPAHLEPVTHRENCLRGQSQWAINARKTHCPRGHAYTDENTQHRRGSRECITCVRARDRERYWQKKREARG
jgi:hypothetical protein